MTKLTKQQLVDKLNRVAAERDALSLKLRASIAAHNRLVRAAPQVARSPYRTPAMEAARATAMAGGTTVRVA